MKLLGHASPHVTAGYAQIHNHTVRNAFQRYCAQRVDATGDLVPCDPDALTSDAERAKNNLARVRGSLPTATAVDHPSSPARNEIRALIGRLNEIAGILRDADPEDKRAIYDELGVELRYHPDTTGVHVAAGAPHVLRVRVGGATCTITPPVSMSGMFRRAA